jgi:hypothetical protein
MKTEHAQVAKIIRGILKKSYPKTKFSVTSKSFAGGDSVRIDWEDGPTFEEIQAIGDKYQAGHFNGMIDLYEYNHNKSGLTVKYVLCQRSMSDKVRADVRADIEKKYGIDLSDDKAVFDKFHCWPDTLIYRESRERTF